MFTMIRHIIGFLFRRIFVIKKALRFINQFDKYLPLSIGTFIEQNATKYPDLPAVLYEEQRYTHRELNIRVNQYANYFLENGISVGDVISLYVENRPEFLFCFGAIVKLKAIVALINTQQRQDVLVHSLKLAHSKWIIVGEELWEHFKEIEKDLDADIKVFFLPDKGAIPSPEGYVNLVNATQKSLGENPYLTGTVMLGDPCCYVYTSGTTGLPKASIMTHFRWMKGSGGFGILALNLKPGDVIYIPLPFYHSTALIIGWASALGTGACMAIRRKFSVHAFWDDIRKYNATCFTYVGELCRYLINAPLKPDDAQHPAYKMIGNGLRPDIWKDFKKRFGIKEVYEFYGASEGNIAFINILNLDCTVGFTMAPYAIVQCDTETGEPIYDEHNRLIRVKKGEKGLLLGQVTQTFVYDGYTDEVASQKKLLKNVFEDGDLWFNSGDILRDMGFRHAQFVDRVGDTFRWKSENVSSTEVDAVINQFEGVTESSAFGVEIPGTEGRAGMSVIVLDGALEQFSFPTFVAYLEQHLPAYAQPVFLRFTQAIETTSTFKNRKGEYRKAGYNIHELQDSIYIRLPKTAEYVLLNADIYQNLQDRKYSF